MISSQKVSPVLAITFKPINFPHNLVYKDTLMSEHHKRQAELSQIICHWHQNNGILTELWKYNSSRHLSILQKWVNYLCVCVCVWALSCFSPVQLFVTHGLQPTRLPCPRLLEWVAMPSSRDLPNLGIEPASVVSLLLAGRFFTASAFLWQRLNSQPEVFHAMYWMNASPK